jgi:hypothetical protein
LKESARTKVKMSLAGKDLSEHERQELERYASGLLELEFGIRLTRQDFDGALEVAYKAGFVPLSHDLPQGEGETPELLVLRLFVLTYTDEIRTASETALRTVQTELARLPEAPVVADVERAIVRVAKAVEEKFASWDIGGGREQDMKPLVNLAQLWAKRLAEDVFNPTLEGGRAAADIAFPAEVRAPAGRAGRPLKCARRDFGVQVLKSLKPPDLRRRGWKWPRCVALMWIVSGHAEFGEGDDGNADAAPDASPKDLRESRWMALIDRATRVVSQDIVSFRKKRLRPVNRRPAGGTYKH